MDIGEHSNSWMPIFSLGVIVVVLIAMPIMKAMHHK